VSAPLHAGDDPFAGGRSFDLLVVTGRLVVRVLLSHEDEQDHHERADQDAGYKHTERNHGLPVSYNGVARHIGIGVIL
jgi:hypothetical protein